MVERVVRKADTRLTVTLHGPIAIELRRVAENFNVDPAVLTGEAVELWLKRKYGITVR